MSNEKTPVYIKNNLYKALKRRVNESKGDFMSVDQYVEFVLTVALKEEEIEEVYTSQEEKEIKKRLKSLGYI